MERLGHNQEKKPERTLDRVKRVGHKILENYGNSLRHGDYYVGGGPGHMFVIPVVEVEPTAELERLVEPADKLKTFNEDDY